MELKKRPEGDTPMASKKFVAYLIAELSWKAIIVMLIASQGTVGDHLVILTIVLIAGFLEVAYILGQAYIDRYMRIADLAFDKAKDVVEDSTRVVTDLVSDSKDTVAGTVVPETTSAVEVPAPVVEAPVPVVAAPVAPEQPTEPNKD